MKKCPKPVNNKCARPCSVLRTIGDKSFCARRTGPGKDLRRRKRLHKLILNIEDSAGSDRRGTTKYFDEAVKILREMTTAVSRAAVKGFKKHAERKLKENAGLLNKVKKVNAPTLNQLQRYKAEVKGNISGLKEKMNYVAARDADKMIPRLLQLRRELKNVTREIKKRSARA